jgi:hypothetical protein
MRREDFVFAVAVGDSPVATTAITTHTLNRWLLWAKKGQRDDVSTKWEQKLRDDVIRVLNTQKKERRK